MSNAAIIVRIREQLAAFERKERTADQLEQILAPHFKALEGVAYSKLKALHDFEYRLVKSQFSDEDQSIETPEIVLAQLREALDAIEKEANQPLQRNASTGSVSSLESPARRG
jgi:biopolymer transport protein ExbB/TolQ